MNDLARFGTLVSGLTLGESDALNLFRSMFRRELNENQSKAVLLLIAKRGVSAGELEGCLNAIRILEPALPNRLPHLMDVCGTGGDGSCSINVSTISSFVIAGSGGQVAKHGNRSITSKCGSSDLIEAFGGCLEVSAKSMIQSIDRCGFGYFHAPNFHPLFAQFQGLRKNIKTGTIFNLLGPLINPLKLRYQMVGVNCLKTMMLYADVLAKQKMKRVMVFHSRDGMDEISPFAVTDFAWLEHGRLKTGWIEPRRYGFRDKAKKHALCGGSPEQNRMIAIKLLTGKISGPLRDIVILNSGAGLWVCERARNLAEGINQARQSIDSGKAYDVLQTFIGSMRQIRSREA